MDSNDRQNVEIIECTPELVIVKEETYDDVCASDENCRMQLCSDNDNIFTYTSTEKSYDVVSSTVPHVLGLLLSDRESRTENASSNYEDIVAIAHIEKETTERRNDPDYLPVYLNDYKQATYPPYIGNNFQDAEIIPDRCAYTLVASTTDDPCRSSENFEDESCGVETFSHSLNEVDSNNQQPRLRRELKGESNGRKRGNLCSASYEMKSKVIRIIKGKSEGKNRTKNVFSTLEIQPLTKHYECEICKKKFSSSYSLKKHTIIHTGMKPFKCDVCGYKCFEKTDLKKHMRNHTGEKPFQCEICGYKFAINSKFQRHMRTHVGVKPFHCEICEYKCTENYDLKKHMMTHTGEKPFQCEICGYKFTVNSKLKRHMGTHTRVKTFECEICGKKCTQNSNLKSHMRIHKKEMRFHV